MRETNNKNVSNDFSESVSNRETSKINFNENIAVKDDPLSEINFEKIRQFFFRRKKIIVITGGIVFATLSGILLFQRFVIPIYKGSFTLLVSDPMAAKKNDDLSKQLGKFDNFASAVIDNDEPTLRIYLRSYQVIEELAKKYNIDPRKLIKRISIESVQDGPSSLVRRADDKAKGVLKVDLITRNRQKDLPLLKDLSETYLQVSLKRRQRKLNDGLDFLNKQQPLLQEKLNVIESQIVQFREKYSLIEPRLAGISIKEQQEIIEAEFFKLSNEKEELEKIKNKINEGSITALGFEEAIGQKMNQGLKITGFDKTLLDQLLIAEEQLAKARSKYTQNSKFVLELEEYVNKIKPLFVISQLEAVDTALEINKTRIETIEKLQSELNDRFLSKPLLIKTFNALEQESTIAKENLFGLEQARENFQLQLAQSSINWIVIDPPAMSKGAIRPNLRRGFVSSLLMAGIVGILVGFIRDRFDNVFHTPKDVEDELGFKPLGNIPYVSRYNSLREEKNADVLLDLFDKALNKLSKSDKNQRFYYQEAFRNLYTSIRFLKADSQIKSLIITSSIPSEGKSLINILLCKTCSDLGKKVLLIDSDLRKPQVHKRLGLNNLKGLSNYLSETNNDWQNYLQDIPKFDNWKVITSGISPPNPSRLLSSQKMKDTIKSITNSNKFDLIVIDTPPVLGLADAPLLTEYVDGIFLLVSIGRAKRGMPTEAIRRLNDCDANFYGVVTNSLQEIKDISSSSSAYGYGYNDYISSYAEGNDDNALEDKKDIENSNENMSLKKIKEKIHNFSSKLIKWLDE